MKILPKNEKGIVSKYLSISLWRRSDSRMMKNLQPDNSSHCGKKRVTVTHEINIDPPRTMIL